MEEHPSERTIGRFARAEDPFAAEGGYAAESQVRTSSPGSAWPPTAIDMPLDGPLRRGAPPRRAGPHPLRRHRRPAARRADQPPGHGRQDLADGLSGRAIAGALLVVSHDLDLLDQAITRVLHLDEGEMVEYKGTYSQYRTARAADEVRLARLATRQQAEINRLATWPTPCATRPPSGPGWPRASTSGSPACRPPPSTGPAKERRYRVKFPAPPHSGRIVLEAAGLAKSYGGPPVFDDISFTVERGAAAAHHGSERCREDQVAADPGRGPSRRPGRSGSVSGSRSATTPRSMKASGPGRPS